MSPSKAIVLIVDDEESIRSTLAGVLDDEGYDTLTAHNGEDALEKVEAVRPDLVFLDIWMPGMDGVETMQRIKSVAPEVEVIIISGHATIQNALEATRRGAFDFIEKPLDLNGILLAADRALDKKLRSQEQSQEHAAAPSSARIPLLDHEGAFSKVFAGRNLGQRTLRRSAILYGQCLHSGQKSGLILEPLPPNSGIHFAQIGTSRSVPAYVKYVQSTAWATRLSANTVSVSTIEHLLSALHAYRISNLLIKCNSEVPILDGSALEFCKVIENIGIEEQAGEWFELAPTETVELRTKPDSLEGITISPSDELVVEYVLEYPKPIGRQEFRYVFRDVEDYKKSIAPARTFGLLKDIGALQKAGLAAGGRLDNFILIGEDGIINTELRFPDELVRHKILDAIGDLFLAGRPLRAHIKATMTGHSDNYKVLSLLQARMDRAANE